MLLNIIIPVAIMSVMYICSIRTIRARASQRPATAPIRDETRMIKVVSALLGFYTISWLPFMVYEFLIMSCDPDQQDCDDYRYFR